MTISATAQSVSNLPKKLHTEGWRAGHVQGIAVDTKQEYIYLSFTTMLVKLDMQGNVVGTVTGILGHLGCLEFNDEDGRLYGSLEYKNDAIGKGILKQEGVSKQLETGFYVAIFDVEKIDRLNMSAEKDGIMKSVLLKSIVEDFKAKVTTKSGVTLEHRYGCSGFDGISFGPAFDGSGKRLLTIAYGIYGDKSRTDNDHQVLLQYDVKNWAKYEAPLSQESMHKQGPAKPYGKYFVYTGNTSWGVQNLEYDKGSNSWFLACYAGKKPTFANYTLFMIDGSAKARKSALKGVDYQSKGKLVPLKKVGCQDSANPEIYGWYNKFAACGICALGDGMFYLAQSTKSKAGRSATIHLARFTGNEKAPFELVK
jgi:hypothetical protein